MVDSPSKRGLVSATASKTGTVATNAKKAALERQSVAQVRRGGFVTTSTQNNSTNWQEIQNEARNMAVKGGPVLFWLVAGIAVCKDLIDILSTIIDAVGAGLALTVIGAPIGAGLAILSEVIDKLAGLAIDATLMVYFGYIGGGFALRLVIMSVGAIIDAIPGLEILPLTTVTFFIAYIGGRMTKKAVQFAESGLGRAVGKTGAAIGGASRAGGKLIRAFAR